MADESNLKKPLVKLRLEDYLLKPINQFLLDPRVPDNFKEKAKQKIQEGLETLVIDVGNWGNENTPDYSHNPMHALIIPVSQYNLPSGDGWIAVGTYDSSSNIIQYSIERSKEEQRETLIHEIAHSIGIVNENFAEDFAYRNRYGNYSLDV